LFAPSHSHALPSNASYRALQVLVKTEQEVRIKNAICAAAQRRIVAGLFGERGEMPLQPPAERAEPEYAAMNGRQRPRQRVFPRHVRQLVRKHGLNLLFAPGAPRGRKENDRM
jgi:hypothetical protein